MDYLLVKLYSVTLAAASKSRAVKENDEPLSLIILQN